MLEYNILFWSDSFVTRPQHDKEETQHDKEERIWKKGKKMATKLIELEDGTLIEVEVPEDEAQQISGGFADKVSASFDKIKPVLVKTCRPITEVWKEINKDMHIEQAEIELGLSFEGEGNLYVTKSKAGANLKIKLVLKPREISE